jgi:hypothetical protein
VFSSEHLLKMKEGVQLFNEQKYWECHEALEDVWMEDRQDPTRNVYWAVIQVAAACIHFRDKNLIGARGMIFKAKEKFRRCREMHILSELAFEKLDWAELEELAMTIPDGESAKLEDFSKLYDFRFKHFPE